MKRETLMLCKLHGTGEKKEMVPVLGYKVTEYLGVVHLRELRKQEMAFGESWSIHHLGTGCRTSLCFEYLKEAKTCCVRISKVNGVPWDAVDEKQFHGLPSNLLELIKEVGEGTMTAEECDAQLMMEAMAKEENSHD